MCISVYGFIVQTPGPVNLKSCPVSCLFNPSVSNVMFHNVKSTLGGNLLVGERSQIAASLQMGKSVDNLTQSVFITLLSNTCCGI